LFEPTTIKKKKTKNKNGLRKKNIKTKYKYGKIKKLEQKKGEPKPKREWNHSKQYLDLKNLLTELYRKEKDLRKELHNKLINQLLQYGDNFKFEKLSYKAWQKMFGKSVGAKAPGLFIELLKYKIKLNSVKGKILEIRTWDTKLSQTCICGNIKKKKLGDRFHICDKCGLTIQRDLLSAYLALFVKVSLKDDNKHYLDIKEAAKFFSGFEQSLVDTVFAENIKL
jgi:transposase